MYTLKTRSEWTTYSFPAAAAGNGDGRFESSSIEGKRVLIHVRINLVCPYIWSFLHFYLQVLDLFEQPR